MKRISPASYIDLLKEIHGDKIKAIDDYSISTKKITHQCLVCGKKWTALPSNVIRAGSGCPDCANKKRGERRNIVANGVIVSSRTAKKTIEQYRLQVNAKHQGKIRVIRYIDSRTHSYLGCNVCQHEWRSLPQNTLKGSKCPNCRKLRADDLKENLQLRL